MARSNPKLKRVFGRVLAEHREAAGFSQESLGFECDIHRTYVSQLERGLKSPSVIILFALATALGTTPSKMLEAVQKKLR